jgi:crotonobetainyl-CoA:carnitine CoA-transferase CaiB-like acyl-CoA transferase
MKPDVQTQLINEAWVELTGGAADSPMTLLTRLELTGSSGQLVSRFAVEETAVACVAVALLAAARLHQRRGSAVDAVTLDREHVAAAVRSERYFRRGGQSSGVGFATLSRFWPAADGWVRTHANYPWHRDALLSVLGVSAQGTPGDVEAVGAAIAQMRAHDVEERVFAAGGIAAAVRDIDEWQAHPQGRALAAEPLIGHRMIGDAARRNRPSGELPASGVRVLDLTRVIAGPVCTRYLGALGAEVLRLDPPHHPDMPRGEIADTLLGKRSAMLDVSSGRGAASLEQLLARADAVVCGYRPGALDRFGLTEDALAARHPGVVVIYLDAWGHGGPWQRRRGFDSVVQAPTGIASGESVEGGGPGALPCQLLDHGTGYLAAAALLDGLYRQSTNGGTHIRRLSLARTAAWLAGSRSASAENVQDSPASATAEPRSAVSRSASAENVPKSRPAPRWLAELASADGPIGAVAPPGTLGDRPLQWPSPLTGYGNDPPDWSL